MATIGIFDSGLGGLSVLRACAAVLPGERYIYFADSAHCPYGEKSAAYIRERSAEIADFLIGRGADIIVVACNTATAAAIAFLRERYSDRSSAEVRERVLSLSGGRRDHVMFIGMEPAVKPAALGTATGVIGVLATAGTLRGSKYLNTKGNYSGNCRICERVGEGFVQLVESGRTSGPEAEETVRRSLEPLLREGADIIVLGCTHYPFLLGPMRKIAGEGIRFIDPAPAVARHLADVLEEEGIPLRGVRLAAAECHPEGVSCTANGLPEPDSNPVRPVPDVDLNSSGDPSPLRKMFAAIF